MKKIAVLIRKENSDFKNRLYIEAIERFSGAVVLIYDSDKIENVNLKLNDVEGILLTGGDDVGRLDFYLIEYALDHDLKLFGICQGMQSMALYGTSNQLVEIGDDSHYQMKKYAHKVFLFSGRLKDIVGKDMLDVNSYHLQTVRSSKNFLISGRSNDDLVEVVENSSHKFQIGVQWHPEEMLDYDEASNKLFDSFVNL